MKRKIQIKDVPKHTKIQSCDTMGMWLRHIIVTVQSNKQKEGQVITGKEWSLDGGVKKERPRLVLS